MPAMNARKQNPADQHAHRPRKTRHVSLSLPSLSLGHEHYPSVIAAFAREPPQADLAIASLTTARQAFRLSRGLSGLASYSSESTVGRKLDLPECLEKATTSR